MYWRKLNSHGRLLEFSSFPPPQEADPECTCTMYNFLASLLLFVLCVGGRSHELGKWGTSTWKYKVPRNPSTCSNWYTWSLWRCCLKPLWPCQTWLNRQTTVSNRLVRWTDRENPLDIPFITHVTLLSHDTFFTESQKGSQLHQLEDL